MAAGTAVRGAGRAGSLGVGSGARLLLYTTRGCYRNPGRDRGLIMGVGRVTSMPHRLTPPARFRDREFAIGFRLRREGVAAPHDGVELASLAGRLDALPDEATWSVRMRRTFRPLSQRDADVLLGLLAPKLRDPTDVLAGYLAACKATTPVAGGAA